jgi:hypothetical protein
VLVEERVDKRGLTAESLEVDINDVVIVAAQLNGL